MPAKDPDLHGQVPDKAAVALLLVDVINDLEWPGGEDLARYAMPMARRLRALKARARAHGIPSVYVNDNFGRWQADLGHLLAHCLEHDVRGRPMVELLAPEADDYFVLKPKHSAFYATPLDLLLAYLRARTLIIAGIAGNICVLFSAHDAYMREFGLVVPEDCVISNHAEQNERALTLMREVLQADTTPSTALDLAALQRRATSPAPGEAG